MGLTRPRGGLDGPGGTAGRIPGLDGGSVRRPAWRPGLQDDVTELAGEPPAALPSPEDVVARLDGLLDVIRRISAGDFTEKPPLPDGDDAFSRFLVGFRFLVDDLERAHEARRQEMDRLREVDGLKTRFINMAAHELGTPLTPIRMQLHVLGQCGGLDERQRRSLSIVVRNVDRLAYLVEDLLSVARLEHRSMRHEPVPVRISALVAEQIDTFQDIADDQGVALVADAKDIVCVVDPHRLGQVLQNLIANAVRFTPTGGQVTVSCRPEAHALLVAVRDTGVGLTADQVARLFRPFSQVHDRGPITGDRVLCEGSGLGLYICKGIVEMHGGRIWCESEGPGRGATFTLRLPRGPAST